MLTANIVQEAFRARNDDGSETTATWIAAANTDWTQDVDTTFRLRFLRAETAGGGENNVSHPLEYSLNSGAWTAVTTTTPVQYTASATVIDGTATTQQLGTGTFSGDPSEFDSDGTVQNAPSWSGNDEVEYEACLTIDSAQVSNSDTIQIRHAGLAGYTNTPTVTAFIAQTYNGTLDAEMSAFDMALTGDRTPPVPQNRDGTLNAELAPFESSLTGDVDQRGVWLNTTQTLTGAERQNYTAWSDTEVTFDVTQGGLAAEVDLEVGVTTRDGSITWSPTTVQFVGATNAVSDFDTVTITAFETTVNNQIAITSDFDTITIVDFDSSARLGKNIVSDFDNITVTEFDTTINNKTNVDSDFDTVSITEFDTTVNNKTNIDSDFDTVSITEFDSTVFAGENSNIVSDFDTIAITDFDSTVIDLQNIEIVSDFETISITDFDSNTGIITNIVSDFESIAIADFDTTVERITNIESDFGTITAQSFDGIITKDHHIISDFDTITILGLKSSAGQRQRKGRVRNRGGFRVRGSFRIIN